MRLLTACLILLLATPAWAADYRPPPGVVNPAVTPETLSVTVCVPGWTATVRPSTSYTTPLKVRMIAERGLPGGVADYQLDHYLRA